MSFVTSLDKDQAGKIRQSYFMAINAGLNEEQAARLVNDILELNFGIVASDEVIPDAEMANWDREYKRLIK